MKRLAVIYESKYGSTKQYASWIAQELSCPLFSKKEFHPEDFKNFDLIIYGGGLYAGGVSGIKLITKNPDLLSGKKIVLFTCGVADPQDPANVAHIRESLDKTIPAEMKEQITFFHLRGGIDYSQLNFVHKSMMAMLRKMLLKKSPQERSDEDMQLLETYGKKINFLDRHTAAPLINYVHTVIEPES